MKPEEHPSVLKVQRAMKRLDKLIVEASRDTGLNLGMFCGTGANLVDLDRFEALQQRGTAPAGQPWSDGGAIVATITNKAVWDGGDF